MNVKEISVVFYQRSFITEKWRQMVDLTALDALFDELAAELPSLGFAVKRLDDADMSMNINGYGDLLNSVRIRCPDLGIGNMCLGHIIGASKNLNLVEDIRRGVNRVAFAPETIEPEGSDKIVCHNCGCGC